MGFSIRRTADSLTRRVYLSNARTKAKSQAAIYPLSSPSPTKVTATGRLPSPVQKTATGQNEKS
jgi:hypothetical protein